MHVCDVSTAMPSCWQCDDAEVQRRWGVAMRLGTAWGCAVWDRRPGEVWPEWPNDRVRSLSLAKVNRRLGRYPRVREPAILERLARCVGVSACRAYQRCAEGDDPRYHWELAMRVVDGRTVRYYRPVLPAELAERRVQALSGLRAGRR